MANQIVVSAGAKVRNLGGVLTATSGVVSSVPLGAANGVATLDSGGKVPVSQLPSSVVTYLGTWNAATNTPTLTNGVGDAGDMYLCNVAGTVNFGAGPITFAVGDWVLYGSGTWQKSNGQNGTVSSVAASITGNSIGITGSPIVSAGTLAFAFSGSAAQYINGAGNLVTFPTIITEAQRLITEVYNETGATLTKGTVVYINGGHGNLPTITKAIATGDATSAQTYGIVQTDITNNNNGYVVVMGSLMDLDTQAYANGTQLYLSSTVAGQWTSVKQYAPAHLVYVAIVTRSHPTQGVVEVRIQNGFEMDELHNVSAQSPSNNQGLFYNTSTSLWENKSIATALGYTPADDSLVVKLAGTQTITGAKTFSGYTTFTSTVDITSGLTFSNSGFTLVLQPPTLSVNRTVTLPNGTGTLALTSDIPSITGLVPYTGATAGVDLGANSLTATSLLGKAIFATNSVGTGGGLISLSIGSTFSSYVGHNTIAAAANGIFVFLSDISSGTTIKDARFNFGSLTNGTTRTYTFPDASGTIALVGGSGVGTVTSVAALTIGTSGTDVSSTVANSTTTPVITLNVPTASATNRGALSSADWTTFNNKQATITLTTTGTSGAATFTSNTLNIPNYGSALSGYLPLTGGTLTGALNINLSSGTALNVAGNAIFRGDTGVGTPRQLIITSGGSTPVYLEAKGYGANYQTDFGIKTFNNVGTAFEVFYADSSGRVGINQVSPSYQLDVNGTGRFSGALTGTTATFSGNVLIGTSTSNGARLEIKQANSLDYRALLVVDSATPNWIGLAHTGSAGVISVLYDGAGTATPLIFKTADTTRLTIASTGAATFSGKVGIGATPYASTTAIIRAVSATSTNYALIIEDNASNQLFEIKNNGAATFSSSVGVGTSLSSTTAAMVVENAGIYGSWVELKATSTGGKRWITQSTGVSAGEGAGKFVINNATDGLNAIVITSTCNVGIGTSSPSGKLMLYQSTAGNVLQNIVSPNGGSTQVGINLSPSMTDSEVASNPAQASIYATDSNYGANIIFANKTTGAVGNALTERMRITSDGNLLLGTTDNGSGAKLVFYSTTAAQQLKAAGTAPAITFSNTITSPTIGGVLGAATAAGHFITGTAAGDMVLANQFSTGALIFGTSNTERMRIINNGNISMATSVDYGYKLNLNGQPGCNGYTAWTNWSDSRLKENVTDFDATNVLDKICAIRPVTYNYNELSGFDEETRARRISGFIAQELKEIFPDMVGTIKKDNVEYYDTNLSNLDLYIVKAIQQLAAEIKTLKNK